MIWQRGAARWLLVLWLLGAASRPAADDIELLLATPTPADPLLLALLLDREETLFAPLCTYASSCLPPFMGGGTYGRLAPRAADAPVSGREILAAVLAEVLSQAELPETQLALLGPTDDGAGRLVQGLEDAAAIGEGLAITLAAWSPLPGDIGNRADRAMAMLATWYRYLAGGPVASASGGGLPATHSSQLSAGRYLPPTPGGSCPRVHVLLALDKAAGALSPVGVAPELAARAGLPLPGTLQGWLGALGGESVDWLPGLSGAQPLGLTWLDLAEPPPGSAAARLSLAHPARLEAQLLARLRQITLNRPRPRSPDVTGGLVAATSTPGGLYLPMYQPGPFLPWSGNVKKLAWRAGSGAGAPELVDARGEPALETDGPDLGRLRFDALTLWTQAAMLPPPGHAGIPDGADGRVVARGGAGQHIPGIEPGSGVIGERNHAGGRQVYVDPVATGPADLLPLDIDLADDMGLQAALGASSADESRELIRWARGQDVDDLDRDGDRAEARSWLLGEVLHSRPLVVDYGALPGGTRRRVIFGSGDGALHIVDDLDPAGGDSGRERYAIYLRELLGLVGPRRRGDIPASRMRYGVDGSPVLFRHDRNGDRVLDHRDGDEVLVIVGLRRGGRSYYAFDISDPDAPPRLRWKVDASKPGFADLALSFSTPVVGKVRYGTQPVDVLVFGGGYHGGWLADGSGRLGKDAGRGPDTRGAAIFIVNARSGELVWKAEPGTTGVASNTQFQHAELAHSIPSAVSALRSPGGVIHRLYVADTGGGLWRVDLPPGEGPDHRREHWFASQLASLAEADAAGDRRFFHPPDIVRSRDAGGDFDGVILASGNRADPLELEARNLLVYIRDRQVKSGDPAVRSRRTLAVSALADRSACALTGATACAVTDAGWRLALPGAGEKALASPVVQGGRVFLVTYTPPAADACVSPAGQSALYLLQLSDATPTQAGKVRYDLNIEGAAALQVVPGHLLLPGVPLADIEGGVGESPPARPCEGLLCTFSGLTRLPLYWRDVRHDLD